MARQAAFLPVIISGLLFTFAFGLPPSATQPFPPGLPSALSHQISLLHNLPPIPFAQERDIQPGDWFCASDHDWGPARIPEEHGTILGLWLRFSVPLVIAKYNEELAQERHGPFNVNIAINPEDLTASAPQSLPSNASYAVLRMVDLWFEQLNASTANISNTIFIKRHDPRRTRSRYPSWERTSVGAAFYQAAQGRELGGMRTVSRLPKPALQGPGGNPRFITLSVSYGPLGPYGLPPYRADNMDWRMSGRVAAAFRNELMQTVRASYLRRLNAQA